MFFLKIAVFPCYGGRNLLTHLNTLVLLQKYGVFFLIQGQRKVEERVT